MLYLRRAQTLSGACHVCAMAHGIVSLKTKQAGNGGARSLSQFAHRGILRLKVSEKVFRVLGPVTISAVLVANRPGAAQCGYMAINHACHRELIP